MVYDTLSVIVGGLYEVLYHVNKSHNFRRQTFVKDYEVRLEPTVA
jgi:hypothetical protein